MKIKIKNIILAIIVLIALSGCIKDFDLNPATTVVRLLMNHE